MHLPAWIAHKRKGKEREGGRGGGGGGEERETRSMVIGMPGGNSPTIYTYLHNAPNITNNGTNRLIYNSIA